MRERKKYKVLDENPLHGKSTVDIECPFCSKVFTAYVWSLAGSGKRCTKCKAIHYYKGFAEK